jgi:hypothetical protein
MGTLMKLVPGDPRELFSFPNLLLSYLQRFHSCSKSSVALLLQLRRHFSPLQLECKATGDSWLTGRIIVKMVSKGPRDNLFFPNPVLSCLQDTASSSPFEASCSCLAKESFAATQSRQLARNSKIEANHPWTTSCFGCAALFFQYCS